MRTIHYAHETCGDFVAGDILVNLQLVMDGSGFGSVVICGFSSEDPETAYARVARPHATPVCVGTTGASVAVGYEIYEIAVKDIVFKDGPEPNTFGSKNYYRRVNTRPGLVSKSSYAIPNDDPRVQKGYER